MKKEVALVLVVAAIIIIAFILMQSLDQPSVIATPDMYAAPTADETRLRGGDENIDTLPEVVTICGDGVCETGEDESCPQDCERLPQSEDAICLTDCLKTGATLQECQFACKVGVYCEGGCPDSECIRQCLSTGESLDECKESCANQ